MFDYIQPAKADGSKYIQWMKKTTHHSGPFSHCRTQKSAWDMGNLEQGQFDKSNLNYPPEHKFKHQTCSLYKIVVFRLKKFKNSS